MSPSPRAGTSRRRALAPFALLVGSSLALTACSSGPDAEEPAGSATSGTAEAAACDAAELPTLTDGVLTVGASEPYLPGTPASRSRARASSRRWSTPWPRSSATSRTPCSGRP
ncbi:hypothetical protein [Cellulosimicrobium sp. CUA-896]|uniref:hypothetical protein n=1 Tax=Cellulosimicrobium sp. CUA-896 TaxID=1517881 RepID=UPI0011151AA1|nr:hypothetical protein [Cellulosimicrobium sp. CUA-896]